MTAIIDWMEKHLLACPFKKYLHIECPGCGLQRSVLAMFRGQWLQSLELYPAALPLIGLLVFVALHIKYKFRTGATIIKFSYISIAFIVVGFYIYKIAKNRIAN